MTSTAENYARAIRSSHLQLSDVEPGDIDILIAAGTLRDGIGPTMLRLQAERDSISGMPGARLVLRMLKNYAPARQLLIRYGSQHSGYAENAPELRTIVETVLDLFLDPNCDLCGGTGVVGAFGTGQPICPTCDGSKKRQVMWPTQESEALAYYLDSEIRAKMDTALRRIAYLMRQG